MNKIVFVLLGGLILFSCSRNEGSGKEIVNEKGQRVEITPLIINSVVLRDTTQVKNIYAATDSGQIRMLQYEDWFGLAGKFLNSQQFGQLKLSVQAVVQDPKSQVYLDWNSKPLTKQEVRDRVIMCDSVMESSFDAQGNEMVTRRWACDSMSVYFSINRIQFYESWYYNKNNNMIERDILGYNVQRYVEDRDAYKTVFIVFKDEAAVEKVKKHYIN